MKAEDKLLLQHIEKHRLVDWLGFTLRAAKAEVENEADEATQHGATADAGMANDDSTLPMQGAAFFGGT